jgi:hypothetical protein
MNTQKGFYTSWETKLDKDYNVGDKITLDLLFGKSTFTVTEKTDDSLKLENNTLLAYLEKEGSQWVWNNVYIDKNAIAKVTIV